MSTTGWTLPENVIRVLETLEQNGYEAYIVGGCVRDHLLGMAPHDWDMTTSATPEQIKRCFRRTYDTGIRHGTVTVSWGGEHFEVTTYRVDGAYLDGRHPRDVTFTQNLREDLRRRDFTMNAIAYSPRRGYADPFGGQADLREGLIRGVGEPAKRFQEDALRMLRAIRFSAQLGFSIEPQTWRALLDNHGLIAKISGERIREEVERLLLCPYTDRTPLLWETGLLDVGAPDAEGLCRALARSPRNPAVRWALLCRELPPERLLELLERLKFDNKTADAIWVLLREKDWAPTEDPAAVRRLLSRLGTDHGRMLLDFLAALEVPGVQAAQKTAATVLERGDPLFIGDLALKGGDLLALGIPAGKQMGQSLGKLLEAVLDDPAKNTPEALRKLLR